MKQATGVRGGLAVHLGTTDGRLEIELARGGDLLVHGLTVENEALATARNAIGDSGLYGLASVDLVESLERLPYADDLVNLLVADLDLLAASALSEIHRVLAPMGVAWLKRDGRWKAHAEPVPADTDEWHHWDHGADGNPFSRDKRIAPTSSLRWLAGATSVDGAGSKVGLRLADGRVYYTGVNYDVDHRRRRTPRSDLFARDAFNGVLRWKLSIAGVPGGGDQPPRFALTAIDGRVYCYPKEGGPLCALDAASGKTLLWFEGGPVLPPVRGWDKWKDPVRAIHFLVRVFDGKVLQIHAGSAYVSDARSGKLIWKRRLGERSVIGWAVAGQGKVFAAVSDQPLVKNRAAHATPADRIVALDAASGQTSWEYPRLAGRILFRMIHFRDSVIVPTFLMKGFKPNFGKDPLVVRLRASHGKVVWEARPRAGTRGHYPIVMARGDEVFVGQQGGFGLDFSTGNLIRKYDWGQLDNSCADLKCVPGYTMYGLTFLTTSGERITRGQTRTICDVGLFPAYGLLYGSPLGCLCSEYVNGYTALSPRAPGKPIPDGRRLVKGPAFGKVRAVSSGNRRPDEWPLHMANARRSSWSSRSPAAQLKQLWQQKLASWPGGTIARDWRENEKIVGLLTAPTVAAGKVFVAAPDAHRLDAMEAATGKRAWSFTTSARIDSPPTVLHGDGDAICLFGCRDGWLYCLQASSGRLVWKFLCARNDRRICVQSQLESSWPVFGSVLVADGGVIAAAGRQSAIDGGISIYKLAPAGGRILWQTRLWTDPDATRSLENRDLARARTRNRRVNDLLVHNGSQACLWITPLKNGYSRGETVDIESSVYSARALRHSVPSKQELRELKEATWLWSASSAGLLSRRTEGVGRHDQRGVNYAHLNATRICLANHNGGSPLLYALEASAGQVKGLRGGLIRVRLAADGSLPDRAEWSARAPRYDVCDAMIVAGDRIFIACSRIRDRKSTIQVYAAADGKHEMELPLPARAIRDGLAAALGKLYVTCEDGTLYCFGKGE